MSLSILKIRKNFSSLPKLRKILELYGKDNIVKIAVATIGLYYAPYLKRYILEREESDINKHTYYFVQYKNPNVAKNILSILKSRSKKSNSENVELVNKYPSNIEDIKDLENERNERSKQDNKNNKNNKKIDLPEYFNHQKYLKTLIMYSIYLLADRTGSSISVIEKMLRAKFGSITSRPKLISAIQECIKLGLLKVHSKHTRSYCLPSMTERRKNSKFRDFGYNIFL